MKVAVLTSLNQWFIPYSKILKDKVENSELFFDHKDIDESYDLVFILSYHKLIEKKYLDKHLHNIVVHASALPQGKGWAPMFWQVLEGKNNIPFTMFEATSNIDDGDIYMQKHLKLTGYELNKELRNKQALLIIEMCMDFLENYDKYKIPSPQKGKESFYNKRSPFNSELDINKTIKEQFNLLRIVDNEEFPAFFYVHGKKYILKIEKSEN